MSDPLPDALPDIDALPDAEAIRLLALAADHATALPDPAQQRLTEAHLREAATGSKPEPGAGPVSAGDLARTTLHHLATDPTHRAVMATAAGIPAEHTRLDPATLAVGALVLLALQTEIDLNRDANGRWKIRIHKHATTSSTLTQLVTRLLDYYRQPPQ